jgi:hypothetical protein
VTTTTSLLMAVAYAGVGLVGCVVVGWTWPRMSAVAAVASVAAGLVQYDHLRAQAQSSREPDPETVTRIFVAFTVGPFVIGLAIGIVVRCCHGLLGRRSHEGVPFYG